MLRRYSTEEEAAEAHDVAALKCHGLKAKTNFHLSRCGAPARAARGARAAAALPAPASHHTRPHGAPVGPPLCGAFGGPRGVRPAHAPLLDHADHVHIIAP